jgi:phage FluMu protein Com
MSAGRAGFSTHIRPNASSQLVVCAMSISLTCPECSGNLKVADNLAGKKIKCPKCSAVFPVSAPEEAAITAEPPPAEPMGITDIPSSDEDFDDEELARPRKKARDIRRDPAGEAVSTLIPYKNAKALIAYYLGVFSFIPCLGRLCNASPPRPSLSVTK